MTDWEPNKGAGEGEHEHYPIAAPDGNGADLGPLRSEQDYIAVQAVRWYVNDQDDFFTDRLATGTAYIGMAGEKYEVALGTYELEGGSRTAPIFDRSILPLRAYRGGDITINLALGGIEKANFVGGLLNEMAKASLDVVASAVSSASVVSPLASAGQTLVQGVKNLFVSGKRAKPIFNPQGFEFQLRSDELIFKEVYVLAHRGRDLHDLAITKEKGGGHEVLADGQPLADGAWVLLRFWRSDRYSGPERPWYKSARDARAEIDVVIQRLQLGGITKDDAIAQLRPTGNEPPTVGDKVVAASSLIAADHALSEVETDSLKAALVARLRVAQQLASSDSPVSEQDLQSYLSFQVEKLVPGGEPADWLDPFPWLAELAPRWRYDLVADALEDDRLSYSYGGGNTEPDDAGGGYRGGGNTPPDD